MNPRIIRVTEKNPDVDVVVFEQEFKPEQQCEQCGETGSYVIIGDPAQIGLCMKHIKETYKKVEVVKQ